MLHFQSYSPESQLDAIPAKTTPSRESPSPAREARLSSALLASPHARATPRAQPRLVDGGKRGCERVRSFEEVVEAGARRSFVGEASLSFPVGLEVLDRRRQRDAGSIKKERKGLASR